MQTVEVIIAAAAATSQSSCCSLSISPQAFEAYATPLRLKPCDKHLDHFDVVRTSLTEEPTATVIKASDYIKGNWYIASHTTNGMSSLIDIAAVRRKH